MEATARLRSYGSNRKRIAAEQERSSGTRRVVTSVRSRRRKPARRSFVQKLLSQSRPRGGAVVLIMMVACGTGTLVSLRLLVRASNSATNTSASGGAPQRRGRVSLGPDAIPSIVLVDRRRPPSKRLPNHVPGSARKGLGLRGGDGNRSSLPARSTDAKTCRNTAQGAALLADSEGRVCRRDDIDPRRPGCCSRGGADTPTKERGYFRMAPPPSAPDSLPDVPLTEPLRSSRPPAGGRLSRQTGESSLDVDTPTQYPCWSCDFRDGGSSCCWSYEFCVACCQDPGRAREREIIRTAAALSGHPAYQALGDDGSDRDASLRWRPLPAVGARDAREEQERAFEFCAFRCRTNSGSVAHENAYRGPLRHCFGRFRPPTNMPAAASGDGSGRNAELRDGSKMTSEVPGLEHPLQLDPFLFNIVGAREGLPT